MTYLNVASQQFPPCAVPRSAVETGKAREIEIFFLAPGGFEVPASVFKCTRLSWRANCSRILIETKHQELLRYKA